MPPQDANPTPSFGGFGLRRGPGDVNTGGVELHMDDGVEGRRLIVGLDSDRTNAVSRANYRVSSGILKLDVERLVALFRSVVHYGDGNLGGRLSRRDGHCRTGGLIVARGFGAAIGRSHLYCNVAC